MQINTKFDLGDKVRIDGGDICGVITTFSIGGDRQKVNNEVTYCHNGEFKTTWCYDWRLEKCTT